MDTLITNTVETIKGYLNATPSAEREDEFFVEPHFLSYYLHADCFRVKNLGEAAIDFGKLAGEHTCESVYVGADDSIDGPTKEGLQFYYFDGDGCPSGPNHALIITFDKNIVYWREPWHNPRTEWNINELADNIKDEAGNFIFPGDPIQI